MLFKIIHTTIIKKNLRITTLLLLISSFNLIIFSAARDTISLYNAQRYDNILNTAAIQKQSKKPSKTRQQKNWTIIVYMAADNDLRGFAARNIKQMAAIGSNTHVNIVVQLDIRIVGNKKITRRYFIEKDKILHVNADDALSQQMDSGKAETLISCCKWAIENYSAQNYMLIFWDHATGILDPIRGRKINSAELFNFNTTVNKFELDRTKDFFDFINIPQREQRGVCWDDSTGNYLTNQKLDFALNEICTKLLKGKKFSIIGFDACLMSMIEVAHLIKKYAHIMIGSQEVELGTGWDYKNVLSPFSHSSLDKATFAQHIVHMYEYTYKLITNDYTQSATNLDNIDALENNINLIAHLLLESLKKQQSYSVKNAIKASRNKLLCTHFDEPSYIDLHHLYANLQANLHRFMFNNATEGTMIKKKLSKALEEGQYLIKQLVFANTTGKNLSQAKGVSIYFPDSRIHPSYRKTTFVRNNEWLTFLTQYLLL